MEDGNVTTAWRNMTFLVPSLEVGGDSPSFNITHGAAHIRQRTATQLSTRANPCSTIQVHSVDYCSPLAAECGISPADFTRFNPSSSLCSGLMEGQHVCCSAKELPDFSPKPDGDGYCYTYLIKAGDSCSSLAAAYNLRNKKIEEFNKNTWGW